MDDLAAAGLERIDDRPLCVSTGAILGFSCLRNERLRLPYFLEYHRKLGVERFFVVDNHSQDGTTQFLLAQQDVHVFLARGSYAASRCGVTWMNALLRRFAPGHWAVTLDADELLVYPSCESVDLPRLTGFLDVEHVGALTTFMIDMYGPGPVRDTAYRSGTPFLDVCSHFDHDTYHERDDAGIPVRGGARHRLFWEGRNRPKPSPVLKKIPLVKWRPELRYEASTHLISGVRTSALTGALLHFKLFSDFPENALREVDRKEHWDDAAQYRSYLAGFRASPDLVAFGPHSMYYENSLTLVRIGLMLMPEAFADAMGLPGAQARSRAE